ncbi:MAG: glycosyltransferase family 4 protein [Bacteroidia bacterium]
MAYTLFFQKRYNAYHSKLLSKSYGNYFSEKIKDQDFDLIIAVSASAELAYLKTDVPVVYVADALFSGALNYYKTLSNLANTSITEGYQTEGLALRKAALCYLPSQWAINNAINDFKIPKNKIELGLFGANLVNIPTREFVIDHKNKKDNSFINLVFVGVNWQYKGGQKAYDCLLALLEKGFKAKLTIVGCTIPENIQHPDLKNISFIKKTTQEGRQQFEELYLNADFHILPTQFEAYGIVFCEASAYGVINIATNTGGTSAPIKEGENGYLMNSGSEGNDYANKIIEVYSNKEKFKELQLNSIKRYEEFLNWDAWAKNLVKALTEKKLISP